MSSPPEKEAKEEMSKHAGGEGNGENKFSWPNIIINLGRYIIRNVRKLIPSSWSKEHVMQAMYTILGVFVLLIIAMFVWVILPGGGRGGDQPMEAETISTQQLPPWFSEWLNQEGKKGAADELTLRCQKTRREDGSGWYIKCENKRAAQEESVDHDESLNLHISNIIDSPRFKHDSGATAASLCCKACLPPQKPINDTVHTTVTKKTVEKSTETTIFTSIWKRTSKILLLGGDDDHDHEDVGVTTPRGDVQNATVTEDTDCQHFSSTLSDRFEKKLRKLLEEEIEKLLEETSVPEKTSCQTKLEEDIGDEFKKTLRNILETEVGKKIREKSASASAAAAAASVTPKTSPDQLPEKPDIQPELGDSTPEAPNSS